MDKKDQIQEEIIEEFSVFDDWLDKYDYLIGLSDSLPAIAPEHRTGQYLIEGCQSRVWIDARTDGGRIFFTADSDAIITKGIIALLIRVLNGRTPQEVLDLIDRTSEDKTFRNLLDYEVAEHGNHVYGLFHWTHRYYSYQALSRIEVRRIANSDMLEISYENDDPGVVYNTLELLNDEFVEQYKELRFGETNDVIRFFEQELARVGSELREQEDSLRDYSVENLIINYDEQTKHIAILSRDFELRYEETRLNLNSSELLRRKIEAQLEDLQIFRNNAAFVEQLHKIGDLQAQITAAEAFIPDPASGRQPVREPVDVSRLQVQMNRETDSLRNLTSAIASQQYTKEGIATGSLIQQWLDAVLLSTK